MSLDELIGVTFSGLLNSYLPQKEASLKRITGYGGSWKPEPGKIRVTTDVCQEKLSTKESDIRPFSDDQNIVEGYAYGDERTNYLPVAHWVSGELGRQLFAQIRSDTELSSIFGPDFKLLASLEVKPDETRIDWRNFVLSVQHTLKLPSERQHRILLPMLEQILRRMEAGGLVRVSRGIGPPESSSSRSRSRRVRVSQRSRWTGLRSRQRAGNFVPVNACGEIESRRFKRLING